MKNMVIIGCGAISRRRHAPALAASDRAAFYGVCDPVKENADALAAQYGVKAFYDLQEVLRDDHVDAVIICTPERFHCANIVAALEAGRDVLTEKPLAMNVAEGRQILEAWRKSGRILMVSFSQRLSDGHQLAKKLLQEGVIGKPIAFRTELAHSGVEYASAAAPTPDFYDRRLAGVGDIMLSVGCHRIDIISWLFDSPICSVLASTPTIDKKYADGRPIDAADTAMVIVELENGLPGTLWTSWCCYGQMERGSVIYGTGGTMSIYEEPGLVIRRMGREPERYEIKTKPEDDFRITHNFIDVLNGEANPAADGTDGMNCLLAMEAVKRANAKGEKIMVSDILRTL